MPLRSPSYDGAGLVNLVAELERRLVGSAPAAGLSDPAPVPDAEGYVLVVFDGLGSHQLGVPAAADLGRAARGTLDAGFPTTTTTSLSTLVTGTAPAAHGVIGHILRLPGVASLVNVLKWMTPAGGPVAHDYASMLPAPNLWERLGRGGVEPITVQPGAFEGSPLSRMLYRGCRFEPIWSGEELVAATGQLAGPGRLVVAYYPGIDVTAHLHGQSSEEYRSAVSEAATIWTSLCDRLPATVGLVGTSDHGHVDYAPADKVLVRDPRFDELTVFGDARSVFVSGRPDLIDALAETTGAASVGREGLGDLLGPGPLHPDLEGRLPDRLLLAPPGKLIMAKPFDKRLVGYHGGLEPAELQIPLLAR